MCKGLDYVSDQAEPVLTRLLADIAEALAPGRGHEVRIGPVDLGHVRQRAED